MTSKNEWVCRLSLIAIWALVLFVVVAMSLSLVLDTRALVVQIRNGRVDSGIITAFGPTTGTFTAIERGHFGTLDPPNPGDTLLTINGEPYNAATLSRFNGSAWLHGNSAKVTFLRDGSVHEVNWLFEPYTVAEQISLWILQCLCYLIGPALLVVSILILIKQPGKTQAKLFALVNLALAIIVSSGPITYPDSYVHANVALYTIGVFAVAVAAFGAGFWLHLALVFPFPSRIISRRPIATYALCYLPALIVMPVVLGAVPLGTDWRGSVGIQTPLATTFYRYAFLAAIAVIVLQIFAPLYILWRKRARAADIVQRRQINAVLRTMGILPIATVVCVLMLLAGVWLNLPMNENWFNWSLELSLALACLAIPVSYVFAFRKDRLLDMDLRIQRGSRFVIATGGLILVSFGMVWAVAELVVRILKIESQTPTLVAALALAFGFVPAQRRATKLVERWFYPERGRLRTTLNEIVAVAASQPSRESLWERLRSSLQVSMAPSRVEVYLRKGATDTFSSHKGRVIRLPESGRLWTRFSSDARPLLVPELLDLPTDDPDSEELQWLNEQASAVILPMAVHSRPVGFLCIELAPEQQDISLEILNLISSVAHQFAMRSENLRLFEENLETQRLQEQMAIAQDVQRHLLPQGIPATPGIQVAVRFIPCMEVGGDYYDVYPLPDGRTMITVGDVSGKGTGAALVMAGVQAALRSLVINNDSLSEAVSFLNDLLCMSTPDDRFVTLFAAVFDPRDRNLMYVNAGHNPPLLKRSNGSLEFLSDGGLLLAAFPASDYVCTRMRLEQGDTFIAYTDGLSEGMNSDGIEFGEESVCAVVQQCKGMPVDELVNQLVLAASEFNVSEFFADDFTVVCFRVE